MLESIDAAHLREVVVGYRDALRAHQERLNRLNVYPVPDGDTGTNMALTLESVVAELGKDADADDMATVCGAISHGSLMGARGNSGVILSQILRGLTGRLKAEDAVDAPVLAEALGAATTAAYEAVMRRVEGTILTVVRLAGGAALAATPTQRPTDAASDDLRYEVMFFLEAPDENVAGFKQAWAAVGDSIVVVGGDGLWNCHIHTNDIGAAVEAGIEAGIPRQIRVTDLAEQVAHQQCLPEHAHGEPQEPKATTAVVAVGSGEGVG